MIKKDYTYIIPMHRSAYRQQVSGPWFNIEMSSYQYRKSHCGDKTVVRSSYLHNGICYTVKMTSLHWNNPLDAIHLSGHLALSFFKNLGQHCCIFQQTFFHRQITLLSNQQYIRGTHIYVHVIRTLRCTVNMQFTLHWCQMSVTVS